MGKERDQLEAELAQVEITAEFQQEIKAMAIKIRDKLSNVSYEGKRTIMDKLNVKVVFRIDAGAQWLDASCGLTTDPIVLHPSRNAYRDRCERSSG